MKSLLAYSLIKSHQHTKSYSLHSIVHDWCIETISCGKGDLTIATLIVVDIATPNHLEAKYWLSQQRLLSHANRCVRHMNDLDVLDQLRSIDAGYALHNLGILYANQGKHAEAKKMYRRALDGKEKASGTSHTFTLDIVNNLRLLNANQGEHIKVEDIHSQRPNSNDVAHGTN